MYDINQDNPDLESLRGSSGLCFGPDSLQVLANNTLRASMLDKTSEEVPDCSYYSNSFEKMVLELSNDFLDKILDFSFKYAKHRGSDTLDPEDIKFAFETLSHVKLTARISDGLRDAKKGEKNPNHQLRLNAIQK